MPNGRPTTYTTEIGQQICDQLAHGMSLRAICRQDGMPDFGVVFGWMRRNKDFAQQYTQAREAQLEFWADEIMDIADDNTKDTKFIEKKGKLIKTVDYDNIHRDRLRVDSRKWILSKLAPKKYGDSAALKLSDADGQPLTIVMTINQQKHSNREGKDGQNS